MGTFRAILAALIAVFVLGGIVSAPTAGPADAAEGDLMLAGHGYGHGRGLSQWGAYGYATEYGWNHTQILEHFYSNTYPGDLADPYVTVRLTALDGQSPQIYSNVDYSVGPYNVRAGHTSQLTRNTDGSWTLTTRSGCGGPVVSSGPLTDPGIRPYAAPTSVVDMLILCGSYRAYRGHLGLVWDGGYRTVNWVRMQDYLSGVVPREVPASWGDAAGGRGMQALMAQSVAARSYAWAENRTWYAKTCDTTSCQVYNGAGVNGYSIEDRRTDDAVAQTWGQVRMLGNGVARTEFSSSSGGYSAGGTFPIVRDDGDTSSPYHDWTTTLTTAQLGALGVGTVTEVTVLKRNGYGADGGRVLQVRVAGSSATKDLTGDQFRSLLGLRSDWFSVAGGLGGVTPDISPVAVAAVRTTAGSVVPFVRGLDGNLYYRVGRNGVFGAWVALPAGTRSGPAAVSWDGQRIDLFVVGSDGALWQTFSHVDALGVPGPWVTWQSLGGRLTSAPAAASIGVNRLTIAARGADGGLWGRSWTGGQWTAWTDLGGQASSAPALEFFGASTYRVRVVGSDGQIWNKIVNARTLSDAGGWEASGVFSSTAPAVSATAGWAASIRAVAWGLPDGAIRQVRADSRQEYALGGRTTSAGAMVEWTYGSVWTFARGTDGALWLNIADSPSSGSNWSSLGGQLA